LSNCVPSCRAWLVFVWHSLKQPAAYGTGGPEACATKPVIINTRRCRVTGASVRHRWTMIATPLILTPMSIRIRGPIVIFSNYSRSPTAVFTFYFICMSCCICSNKFRPFFMVQSLSAVANVLSIIPFVPGMIISIVTTIRWAPMLSIIIVPNVVFCYCVCFPFTLTTRYIIRVLSAIGFFKIIIWYMIKLCATTTYMHFVIIIPASVTM
jgi:hypothetical protein